MADVELTASERRAERAYQKKLARLVRVLSVDGTADGKIEIVDALFLLGRLASALLAQVDDETFESWMETMRRTARNLRERRH